MSENSVIARLKIHHKSVGLIVEEHSRSGSARDAHFVLILVCDFAHLYAQFAPFLPLFAIVIFLSLLYIAFELPIGVGNDIVMASLFQIMAHLLEDELRFKSGEKCQQIVSLDVGPALKPNNPFRVDHLIVNSDIGRLIVISSRE